MQPLRIQVSPKQASRLRCGHKVRIAPALEGEGIILLVHPDRYNPITRTFRAGKRKEIQLLPEEIQANKTPELQGQGIFGKKFDKDVQGLLGKKAKEDLYEESKRLKEPAKAAVQRGADKAKDFIDGGSLFGKKFDQDIQKLVGKKAKEDVYQESKRLKEPAKAAVQRGADKAKDFIDGGSISSIVGRKGNLIHSNSVHPALLSQPLDSNYQFHSTLPGYTKKYGYGLYV